MKKFVFLPSEELSKTVQDIYLNRGEAVKAVPSFCEETERDIVIITKGEDVVQVSIEDLQSDLSVHFGHSITHYDEMEVGDLGVGFLFFF